MVATAGASVPSSAAAVGHVALSHCTYIDPCMLHSLDQPAPQAVCSAYMWCHCAVVGDRHSQLLRVRHTLHSCWFDANMTKQDATVTRTAKV